MVINPTTSDNLVHNVLELNFWFCDELEMEYSYGYNSKEKDDEVKGRGNSYDFGARMYDSRLGRFLSLDPKFKDYPFMSPYCFAANNPIRYIDVNGEGPGDRVKKAKSFVGKPYQQQTEWNSKRVRTYLRTGTDDKALEYLDCSELVCRVLADDGLTSEIKTMATPDLIDFFSNTSKWHGSNTPHVGDVFLRKGGHTGIVTEVYDNGTIEITHAANTKRGTVVDIVKVATFVKQGGWQGFFQPLSEHKKSEQNVVQLDEVTVNGERPENSFKPKSSQETIVTPSPELAQPSTPIVKESANE